jgi:hypothetical protein
MYLKEGRKHVRPLTVLNQGKALAGESVDDLCTLFDMDLVDERLFA